MFTRISKFVQRVVHLFTGDLSREEFSNLFNNETRGTYDFFLRHAEPVEGERNAIVRFFRISSSLFVAFLNKLSPARRLFYGVALVLVILGWLSPEPNANYFYAFVIVNFLLALEMSDRLTTRDELDVARDIQESLRPESSITDLGYEIASFTEPARNVGGDYHDILRLSDGSLLAVIADVSGKGISAALYAAKLQTALQLFAEQTDKPSELLELLDEYLRKRLKKNFFITLSAVRLSPNGSMELCRAGHPPAIRYSAVERSTVTMQPKGIALGLHTDSVSAFGNTLEKEKKKLVSGDIVLLYTDGVVESISRGGNEFGEHRIELMLKTFPTESAAVIKERIAAELSTFREGAELRDDTTFMVIKRL